MRRTPVGSTIALVLLSSVALGLVVNVASGELPEAWAPYRWLSWPLVFVLAGIVVMVTVRAERSRDSTATGGSNHTRRDLIGTQRSAWIDDYLKRSLYRRARLRLEFTTSVDAPHPWVTVFTPETAARPLETNESIADVFDTEMHGRMLILGAPGAGKTTTLLELLDVLLDKAADDAGAPIPLMANLATWTGSGELADWILNESSRRYQVPREHLAELLRAADLVLLLDGLDEVAEKHRLSCLRAVNALRGSHPNLRMVVCSRTEEYRALGEEHALRGRIEIQPLTPDDITHFLRGQRMAHVLAVLDAEPDLRALVTTPLLLSVLMLAYQDAPKDAVTGADALDRLFTAYIRRMLGQRYLRLPARSLLAHLVFVAASLKRHDQTLFGFDTVDDRWSRYKTGWLWRLGALKYAPLFALPAWWWGGWPGAAVAVGVSLLFMLPNDEFTDGGSISFAADSHRRGRERLRPSLVDDVTMGFEDLWEFRRVGLAAVAVATAGVGVVTAQAHTLWTGVWFGLATVAAGLLALAAVEGGFVHHVPPVGTGELPSPMVRAVRRHGLFYGAAIATAVFALTVAVTVWSVGLDGAVPFAAALGAVAGSYVYHGLAGFAAAEQRAVRRRLARVKALPVPAAPWLEQARECLLLQRVGNDYIFVHLLLRDHLAGLAAPDSPAGLPAIDPAHLDRLVRD